MHREKIGLLLLLMATSLAAITNNWLHKLDEVSFDIGQLWHSESHTDDIAIVEIDQEYLNKIGIWPQPRIRQTELLGKICDKHPRVVVLHIQNASVSDSISDQVLANQIKDCGNVVLTVNMDESSPGGVSKEVGPNKLFIEAARGAGQLGLRKDDHGGGYGVDLYEGVGTPSWPTIAKVALDVAGYTESYPTSIGEAILIAQSPYRITRREYRLINYKKINKSDIKISASSIMAGVESSELLNNKIVILGPAKIQSAISRHVKSGLDDQDSIEAETIANLVSNIIDNELILPIAEPAILVATILLTIIPVVLVVNLSPLRGLIACWLWIGFVFIGAGALPVILQIWIPPSGILLAAMLAYPIWSWRRLEASQRHLDWQLRQLADENDLATMHSLGYEKRIYTVQVAQAKYKELQNQRDEMLAFFSHDIRAPLAIVASQISGSDLPDSVKQRLILQLNRAHDLAQGFLSLIRAQSITQSAFEEVDLIAILHQSIDGFYERSMQLKVTLTRELEDDPIWIKGDFGLLQRAFENLLGNALKYAPSYSEVLTRVELKGGKKIVSILDSGPGVSPDLVNNLFRKFSTNGGVKDGVEGNGLGLYFVHTVALRHNATCGYSARKPHGANFWIEF